MTSIELFRDLEVLLMIIWEIQNEFDPTTSEIQFNYVSNKIRHLY